MTGRSPHLRTIVVSGPHYSAGLLTAASTRQPGMVLLTDLTPTVLGWLGTPVPAAVVGSPLRAVHRAGPAGPGLAAALRTLAGQDAAAQVHRHTVTPFYQLVGFGYPALFALIALIAWAGARIGWAGEPRRRARFRAAARAAAAWAASLPAGTFLASLVPWWALGHPALVLYALAVAWAAAVAAVALAGPWRRDPLGPPGMIAAVTLGVIGLGLITGSRLMLEHAVRPQRARGRPVLRPRQQRGRDLRRVRDLVRRLAGRRPAAPGRAPPGVAGHGRGDRVHGDRGRLARLRRQGGRDHRDAAGLRRPVRGRRGQAGHPVAGGR